MSDAAERVALARYTAQAEEARRNAQIAEEEAHVSESFAQSGLLEHARQLREQAERFDRYAEEIRSRGVSS
jgi:hypothetical protein